MVIFLLLQGLKIEAQPVSVLRQESISAPAAAPGALHPPAQAWGGQWGPLSPLRDAAEAGLGWAGCYLQLWMSRKQLRGGHVISENSPHFGIYNFAVS